MRQRGRGRRFRPRSLGAWPRGPARVSRSHHSCWTSRNMRSPGLGARAPVACRAIRQPLVRDPPLLEFNGGAAGRQSADAATYFLQRALRRSVALFWQATLVTAARYAISVMIGRPFLTPNWPICGRDLGPEIPDRGRFSQSWARGLRPPSWAVSYRLGWC